MDEFYPFLEALFLAIITVGIFFILWDIYFAYQNVWGFNDEYLMGIRWFKLPLEEWLFFFYSLFQQFYSLFFRIFLPEIAVDQKMDTMDFCFLLIVKVQVFLPPI